VYSQGNKNIRLYALFFTLVTLVLCTRLWTGCLWTGFVPAAVEHLDKALPAHASYVLLVQVSMFLHSTGVLITIFPGKAAGGGSAAAKVCDCVQVLASE
jgi:hypothetical protein